MKNLKILILIMLSSVIFSSCGVNSAMITNQNQNSTQVFLGGNNFEVVDRVSASAEVKYVFLIGGMSKKQLYDNAYASMVKKAGIMSGSKALINIVTEEHFGGFPPFFLKRTITVSAHVIEFTDK